MVFDYSKSPELILRFIKMGGIGENDIVLDFFSGSATTAHAVMQLNAEDGGNRKFIMVQLPEPCDEKARHTKQAIKTFVKSARSAYAGLGTKSRQKPGLI